MDSNVALDTHRDMGEYLRALGVREMIQLVSQVQEHLAGGVQVLVKGAREQILNRRAH